MRSIQLILFGGGSRGGCALSLARDDLGNDWGVLIVPLGTTDSHDVGVAFKERDSGVVLGNHSYRFGNGFGGGGLLMVGSPPGAGKDLFDGLRR